MTVDESATGATDATDASELFAGTGAETARRSSQLVWEGDLDIASAPVLTAALRVLADLGRCEVDLDLAGVTFMDCAGLGALLEADARRGGDLVLRGPSGPVLRLLALVGLGERFVMAPTGSDEPVVRDDSREAVERSKGLIMSSFGCTVDQATRLLVQTSRQRNVQVHVLAGVLVAVTSTPGLHDRTALGWAVRRVMAPVEAA